MQIVASNCKSCGKPVVLISEGIGCPGCRVAFHRACLEGSNICPQCHEDMVEMTARGEAAEVAAHDAVLRSGRRQMHIVLGLLGALVFLNLFVPVVFGSPSGFAVGPWVQ